MTALLIRETIENLIEVPKWIWAHGTRGDRRDGQRGAVAEELAGEGAYDAIRARTAGTLAETAANIQKTIGGRVLQRALDVTDSAAVTVFVAAADARFHRIDVCVTNSGGPPSNLSKDTPPEAWRARRPASDEHRLFAKETLPRMQRQSRSLV